MKARAERGVEGDLYVVGSTNFPDGMKMWVHVGHPKVIASDDGVRIHASTFSTIGLWADVRNPHFTSSMLKSPDGAKLKFRKRPIPAGIYKAQFEAYFNGGWQTSDVLQLLGGEGGKSLRGSMFRLVDPDVIDSGKKLDYSIALSVPTLTPEASAIALVKAARLAVSGQGLSATDVEATIDLFMTDPGIRRAKGWSAAHKSSGLYEVTFDFIDGKAGEEQALWSADLAAKTVKYINKAAKNFSWAPDY